MLHPVSNGRTWLCLIVSLVMVEPLESASVIDTHTRLYRTLLKDYEKDVPPLPADGNPVDVNIIYDFEQLVEMNEKDDIIVMSATFFLSWTDSRLSWNQSNYDNISSIRVDNQKIWAPDLVIFNSVDPLQYVARQHGMAVIVHSSGGVGLLESPITRTFCQMDLSRFPYDTQTCQMGMGSWTYSDEVMKLTSGMVNGNVVFSNTEWDLLLITKEIIVNKYICCPEGYPEFKVNVTLRRKPGFYGYMFASPAVLLSLLTPIIFLIPPSSGERTTLASVLLLCLFILLQLLDRHLPPQQVSPPFIGLYYTCTMVFVSVALGLSAFIVNIKTRGNRQNGVPTILRKIFLGPIKSLVFMDSENFRPFNNITPSGTTGVAIDPPRQMGDNSTTLERQLGDLVRQLASINYIREREQIINNIVSDWHDLVLVLDRIFFVLFVCSNIIITMAFLI